MKRLLLFAVTSATIVLSMSAAASARSMPIVIADEGTRITVVADRFAVEVRHFAQLVEALECRVEPQALADGDGDLFAARAKARYGAYMAAGEQLVAPRDNPAIGERRRL